MPGQAAIVEIGARPFAAMVEEADVVIGFFERLDFARDEAVELVEIGYQIGRQVEVHGVLPCSFLYGARLGHDPEKWKPVFRKDHAQITEVRTGKRVKQVRPPCGAASACVMGWRTAARAS